MVLCNYQPACSFTARSHSNTRAAAELRAAAQQTAPSTLNPTAARLAAPRSLSAHDQRPDFLALPLACDLTFLRGTASGHLTGTFNPHKLPAVSSN